MWSVMGVMRGVKSRQAVRECKFTHNYKGNTVAKVKMDDIIMSKNEQRKPNPHQATQSIL